MNKKRIIIGSILLILLISVVTFYAFHYNDTKQYSEQELNQIVKELQEKDYIIDIKDVDKDILVGKRKWLTLNNDEHISAYLYADNKRMEDDAARISTDGCSYNGIYNKCCISWISYPYFYKKNNTIVLYVGENRDLINTLEEVFVSQFAGHKG